MTDLALIGVLGVCFIVALCVTVYLVVNYGVYEDWDDEDYPR